ncbi:TonB-dependent receptor domain-containing protein [Novosphingobium sp. 9]|uniref:TonB-dependent receptor domain-containing protein n=1 Tax=Novosphingobium sp. 9 TaxID=2025349 RepID=UPI0021B54A14|nr:TonB-dependent receptor [Novosphingobium sp. 9]
MFRYDNSLIGFYGFGRNPGDDYTASPYNGAGSSKTGAVQCFTDDGGRLYDNLAAGSGSTTLLPGVVSGSPCTNLGVYDNGTVKPVTAKGNGVTYRFNAQWKPSRDVMLYATWSKGYRPGGINRRGDFGSYKPDYLVNYELGFKTTLLNGLVRLNGAIYQQNWEHFQFSYLGPNSFTIITNGPNARIRGAELDVAAGNGPLTVNWSAAYTDAKTRQNLCSTFDATFTCAGDGNSIDAPAGTRLPITPKFKTSATARYTVPMGAAKVYGQLNGMFQTSATPDLRVAYAEAEGKLKAYGLVNLAVGSEWSSYSLEFFVSNLFDVRGDLSKYIACGVCTQRTYIVPTTPRMIGIRAGAKF